MSDRVLRLPDRTWDELEGLPQPLRNTAHRRSSTCSKNRSRRWPSLSRRGPATRRLRLHLPSDGLTIWYTVTDSPEGQVVIVVQYVKADT